MSTILLAVVAVILCIIFRILNFNTQPQKPVIWCKDGGFLGAILNIAPMLTEPYIPTRLWGFNGHVQTILHSVIGRVKCPWPIGCRVQLTLPDRSTLTYDLYEPLGGPFEDDITIAICPGIGNTSESVYIRTFVHYSQYHGYRCAVLNHIGALNSVQITSSRIFTYGHTEDFGCMLESLLERYPSTRLVLVGFSLGGNLVTKYLGEKSRSHSPNIIGGISICQGYNAIEALKLLLNWQNFRRVYLYVMTDNYRNIITRHKHILLSEELRQRHQLSEHSIVSAATLPDLDEAYTRKVFNFNSVTDLYYWSSSINYLDNICTPMVFINAKDDPLVPDALLAPIREFASTRDKVAYFELAHGGHLGFYEGGTFYPNPVTWLDKAIVAITGGLVLSHHKIKPPPSPGDALELPEREELCRTFKQCSASVQAS